MTIIKNFYDGLAHKKVEIYTKPIGTHVQEKYVGTVVTGYNTAGESFMLLDTKELINIKYIAVIKILD